METDDEFSDSVTDALQRDFEDGVGEASNSSQEHDRLEASVFTA